MIKIKHRINTLNQLKELSPEYGAELDLRSQGDKLIIHHDPFVPGEDFEEWIKHYHHGTLILNVKEEGLEKRLIELMNKYQITDFFFLDQSFPFLVKTANTGEKRCAVRYSEYESIDTVLSLAHKIEWVWVDCFTRFPITKKTEELLHNNGFKLCLVSPELQGRTDKNHILDVVNNFKKEGIVIDAVCTKFPEYWD